MKISIPKRKLISKSEDKVSWLQIVGFFLILAGIGYLVFIMFFYEVVTSTEVAIIFFDVTFGVAFAFPDMLKDDNKQVSTMRIVVFMFVNVICMLLLKIGWDKDSLEKIGIDGYWMGIIGFLFGAKAAQAYFESKLAAIREKSKSELEDEHEPEPDTTDITNAEMAKLAVVQNEEYLKIKFPNIISVSDAVNDLNKTRSHVVTIYVKDNDIAGIPDQLKVNLPNGKTKLINTEIITGLGKSKVHVHEGQKINTINHNDFGSICCLITSLDDDDFKGVVTAGHVYTRGHAINMRGRLSENDQLKVQVENKLAGRWIYQTITNGRDIAIASLENKREDNEVISFKDQGFQTINDNDVKKCVVTLVSEVSGTRQGFIVDYNLGFDVPYNDEDKFMSKIILVGSTRDRQSSKTLSKKGDSGGCVYNSDTKQLIGLILGGDDKFTYVLSIKDILEKNNYQLV